MESRQTESEQTAERQSVGESARVRWYVMRDLKRANALQPAYKMLRERGFEVFTPMKWQLTVRRGKRIRREVPFMQDLLFVHASRESIDPVESRTPTLQYRFVRNGYRQPMFVRDEDMERFIFAVNNSPSVRYYSPAEITQSMYGRTIRIAGGPLEGYEGTLLTVRGSKVKRLVVSLPEWMSAAVEVNPEYIQML